MPDPQSSIERSSLPPHQPLSQYGGHIRMFWRDRTGFLVRNAWLGDVSYMELGPQPIYFLNHPDLIRDMFVTNASKFVKGSAFQRAKHFLGNGLITSDGQFHLRQRRMMQPAFHNARIREYMRPMITYAERMAEEWQDGETRDINREMMHLTLQVVGNALFGAEMRDDADELAEALSTAMNIFNYLQVPFSELLEDLPESQSAEFIEARDTLDRIVGRIIRERRKDGGDRGDLLSMLLMARDEDDGSMMTDEQVRDEAMTLFLAGHETTATAMTWMWYMLSENPDKAEKLHAEIDSVLGTRQPAPEDVMALKYTEAVFAETMRLFPPVWSVGRHVVEDHEIAGYNVPAGSFAMVSQYVMHRDPRFWDEPDSFIPERWEKRSTREASKQFIYFPFGGGVRKCIGEGFSWMEGVTLTSILARKWKLTLDPEQRIGFEPLITLRPKYGMRMKIEAR
ncbi:MAG: cytochrome P450 [Acidobacteria bacterium]|nr:cytochrome P450 [Acidobacteriota bacterium]